jgi:hypothetical protein
VTHCERILQLLSDGRPHSHLELYALGTVAHSRISDLRKKGYTIEQSRDGDLYLYRLVSLASAAAPGEGLAVQGTEAATVADNPLPSEPTPMPLPGEAPPEAISLTLFPPPTARPAWA